MDSMPVFWMKLKETRKHLLLHTISSNQLAVIFIITLKICQVCYERLFTVPYKVLWCPEVLVRRCYVKQMFLKNSRNSQVKAYTRLWHNMYFPVSFEKLLRTSREQLHLRATASGWHKEALIILLRMAW